MAFYAALDCGTNTFHLVIAEIGDDHPWEVVCRKRVFVYLAQHGIHDISPKSYNRALKTIEEFASELKKYTLSGFRAVGTAALRTAKNASEFINEVKEKFGINIEVISGEEEAHLIQKGASFYAPRQENPYLIMDIGGGSVEFIIWKDPRVLWAKSFQIGVFELYTRFQKSEPISQENKKDLTNYLKETLAELQTELQKYSSITLLGAAGTFDVIENMIGKKTKKSSSTSVILDDFYRISEEIQRMDLKTRLETPGIPEYRAEMLVVALILIDYVLKLGNTDKICIVQGDIKDGILLEMIE